MKASLVSTNRGARMQNKMNDFAARSRLPALHEAMNTTKAAMAKTAKMPVRMLPNVFMFPFFFGKVSYKLPIPQVNKN